MSENLFSVPDPIPGMIDIKCGIDEVGRGAYCGPLVVCGVFNPYKYFHPAVKDSKAFNDRAKITKEQQRKNIADQIKPHIGYVIQPVTPAMIDMNGMGQAMSFAVKAVRQQMITQIIGMRLGNFRMDIIMDGDDYPKMDYEQDFWDGARNVRARVTQECVIKADATVFEVSAASIIAKDFRDTYMREMAQRPGFWPYDLVVNKGYGSPKHEAAIVQYGLTAEHRRSFVRTVLARLREIGAITDSKQLEMFQEKPNV